MKSSLPLVFLGFVVVLPVKGQEVKNQPGKSRSFQFTYAATIKDLKPGADVRIWVPLPQSNLVQTVKLISREVPGKIQMGKEPLYGNQMLYGEAKAGSDGSIPLKLVFDVTRREVQTGENVASNTDPVARFLEADKMVPVTGKALELIREKKLPADQVAKARVLYDVVNSHMKYDKSKPGWGRGDAEWACDGRFGNCTDFHSLFISMVRGNQIPAKFEMGFSIPEKPGPIGGYHCWAWFLPRGKSWIPVDISEANRFPNLKEYYFGNLSADRIQFTTGRDINLVPRQNGPALNFFIYPYVEVNGKPHDAVDRSFSAK